MHRPALDPTAPKKSSVALRIDGGLKGKGAGTHNCNHRIPALTSLVERKNRILGTCRRTFHTFVLCGSKQSESAWARMANEVDLPMAMPGCRRHMTRSGLCFDWEQMCQ